MTVLLTIYGALALLSLLFIIIYAPRRWWKHVTGHSIMATKVGIFFIALAVIAATLRLEDSVILLGAAGAHLAIVMVLRVILLFTTSRPKRQPKRSDPSNSKAD